MIYSVPILAFVGCIAAAVLAWRSDVRGLGTASCLLLILWALANAAWVSDNLWMLPGVDLGIGVAALNIWRRTRAEWAALIVHAVSIRLTLHVLDAVTGHIFLVAYIHALNATFAWMLVVVAGGGGNGSYRLRHRVRNAVRALAPIHGAQR